jgi:large subunit ribosomal protein L35
MHRALVRPLRVYLASCGSLVPPSLSAPLQSSGCSPLSTFSAACRAPFLAAPFTPSSSANSLPRCLFRQVRWGSRKAGPPTFKTKSAVKKRFRVTGGGSLKRMPSGKRHLNLHKSSSRIRRLGWWQCLAWGFSVHFHHSCSGILFTFSPKPPTPLFPSPCAGPQKTIANKGLRKRYLRVMGLSPFKK